jgi:hypothetical protein
VALVLLSSRRELEALVSTRTLGILASLVGSAIGAWWVINQRRIRNSAGLTRARDHGTVIFDNTPSAAEIDAVL